MCVIWYEYTRAGMDHYLSMNLLYCELWSVNKMNALLAVKKKKKKGMIKLKSVESVEKRVAIGGESAS